MPDETTAALIRALADPNAATRHNSAAEIFRRGSELVAPLVRQWLTDSDLAPQIVSAENHPRLTIGVAVAPARFDQIRAANGSPHFAEVPPDQDAKEFELEFAGGVRLDILTTRDPAGAGAIARYLQKLGEGIQQVEVDVHNVERAIEILRSRFRVQPIYPVTRPGANGTRVNFFLVAVPGGRKVLVELVQSSDQAT